MIKRLSIYLRQAIALLLMIMLFMGSGCSDSPNTRNVQTPTDPADNTKNPGLPVEITDPETLPKSEYIWPLCGRIAANPPEDWTLGDDCPEDRQTAAFDDTPLGTSFGPRLLPRNGDYRYDFHRGLDIPADIDSPLFAVAAGEVIKAGSHPSFTDGVIEIRHFDPDTADCDITRCVSSFYLHINSPVVQIGDRVTQGQMIGYSGASFTSYEHLHFEIRQAPGSHDRFSNWQRDSQHPFAFLDYHDSNTDNITLTITDVDRSNPMAPIVTVNIRQPRSVEMDFNRVEIEVRENQINGTPVLVSQLNHQTVGNTPENTPYDVNPPFFDMQLFNRQYSYKNSEGFPWSVFETSGLYQSPFHEFLPASYNPNVHLDRQLQTDTRKGDFNGMIIAPAPFSTTATEDYSLDIVFNRLTGTTNAGALCIRARVIDASNNTSEWIEDGCNF